MPDLSDFTSYQLYEHCQRQQSQQKAFVDDLGYCFELFCRAVNYNDDRAWELVEKQFKRLILAWIRQNGRKYNRFFFDDDIIEMLWVNAQQQFWHYAQRKKPLDDHFKHVGGVLAFWSACTRTVVREYCERLDRHDRQQKGLVQLHGREQQIREQYILDDVANSSERQGLITHLYEVAQTCLHTPEEKLVFFCCFELDEKPSKILANNQNRFKDVKEINSIRAKIIKRIKRKVSVTA